MLFLLIRVTVLCPAGPDDLKRPLPPKLFQDPDSSSEVSSAPCPENATGTQTKTQQFLDLPHNAKARSSLHLCWLSSVPEGSGDTTIMYSTWLSETITLQI